jgi:hypothetical protein
MDGERSEVELHSHDFEWEELARTCRALDDDEEDGADECVNAAEGLADEAKSKWDAFHARNKGGSWTMAPLQSRG